MESAGFSAVPFAEPAWTKSSASPYYNESHRRLREYCRKYIDHNIIPHVLEWEERGEAPREEASKWARSGIPFSDIPERFRPKHLPQPAGIPAGQHDVFHLLIITDEVARIEGGVGVSLQGASLIGSPPVLHYGTEAQKQKLLPGLFSWETSFCLGVTEASGGSDVARIRTTARKTPDGQSYIVNGLKKWITAAPWATHMTTAVRTGGAGLDGISVLLIPMDSPGLSIRKIYNSGQNAGGSSFVELDNVKVDAQNLIGEENQGFPILMKNFNKERFVMATQSNRKARTCLSHALEYAHERETFGQPLIANQVIRRKISQVAQRVEAHWAWLEQIAFTVQNLPQGWQAPEIAGRIALAKVMGGQILELAAREAQQIFGGNGYQRGGRGATVEQISRDLRMMIVGGGSEEIISDLAVRQEIAWAKKNGWKL